MFLRIILWAVAVVLGVASICSTGLAVWAGYALLFDDMEDDDEEDQDNMVADRGE